MCNNTDPIQSALSQITYERVLTVLTITSADTGAVVEVVAAVERSPEWFEVLQFSTSSCGMELRHINLKPTAAAAVASAVALCGWGLLPESEDAHEALVEEVVETLAAAHAKLGELERSTGFPFDADVRGMKADLSSMAEAVSGSPIP
jgi:hypothetical protein